MKTKYFIKNCLLLHFAFYVITVSAQEPKFCGSYKIDTAALNKALKAEKIRKSARTASGQFLLRVFFHILRNDDGSNAAATTTQLTSEFNNLAANYAQDNICFLNTGFDYVNSTSLNTGFNANTDPSSLFDSYRVPTCINVFYLQKISGTNSACSSSCGIGGTSLKIPNTFCLIAKSNIGASQTIAHEVGHCMGLLHTFETATDYEDIDGSNSKTSGDLIGDTPADPFAYNDKSCFSVSSCLYNGSCTDPKGKSNFSPPYTNLMAYWWSSICARSLSLTGGQYERVNSYLSSDDGLISCESNPYVTISNLSLSSGYYVQSAVNTLTTADNVNISSTSKTTLGGALVLLEPGFHALPGINGLVLLRVKSCGSSQRVAVTSEDQNLIAAVPPPKEKIKTNINTLIVYPNPTTSLINLAFSVSHNEDKISVHIYDVNGRSVKEVSLNNVLPGKHTTIIDIHNLSNGVYNVVLQLHDSFMRAAVVLSK